MFSIGNAANTALVHHSMRLGDLQPTQGTDQNVGNATLMPLNMKSQPTSSISTNLNNQSNGNKEAFQYAPKAEPPSIDELIEAFENLKKAESADAREAKRSSIFDDRGWGTIPQMYHEF